MQRIYKNYYEKNNIILFITLFILFGLEEVVLALFYYTAPYKLYFLIYLASINYFIKSYFNVIRISIIGLILSFFVLNGYNDLINKSLFRFIVLIISFACLDIIVSKVKIYTFEKSILYISSLIIIFSMLTLFLSYFQISTPFSLSDHIEGSAEDRFKGIGANSIVIGI